MELIDFWKCVVNNVYVFMAKRTDLTKISGYCSGQLLFGQFKQSLDYAETQALLIP